MMKRLAIEAMRQAGEVDRAAGTLMNSAEDLIARVRAGDDEAFRLIFERYARPVLSFIYDLVGERALAEELMQETFVRGYKNLAALRDETKLSTWLFGIARNVARESLRTQRRTRSQLELDDPLVAELHDHGLPPDDRLINKEMHRAIREALGTLDEDKRLIFALRVFQQQSYEEIALITGFSMAKLKTDLHRARAEMRKLLRPYLEVGDEV